MGTNIHLLFVKTSVNKQKSVGLGFHQHEGQQGATDEGEKELLLPEGKST